MKNLLITFLFFFITIPLFSQTESSTVMIKSVETYGNFSRVNGNIYVIDETGKETIIDLEKFNVNGIAPNMNLVKSTLDQYINKGFEVISSTATSFGDNAVYTIVHTYLLKKEE
jgi:hypothetical protein